MPSDTPASTPAKAGKVRLVTIEDMDRRTRAAQQAVATKNAIIADLGGVERLSTPERLMAEHAALARLSTRERLMAEHAALARLLCRTVTPDGLGAMMCP